MDNLHFYAVRSEIIRAGVEDYVAVIRKISSDSDERKAEATLRRAAQKAGNLVTADAQVQAYGEIKSAKSLAGFAGLKLTTDEAKTLAGARPGDAVNLSAGEIAAFKAIPEASSDVVQEQLRKMLLARYEAYRASGLSGIAAYDRGGDRTTDLAGDLHKASEALPVLKKYLPGLQAVLLGYPKATPPPALRESFFWAKSIIEGKSTYMLMHVLSTPSEAARVLVWRRYYASTGFNGGQSIAGLFPVQRAERSSCTRATSSPTRSRDSVGP